MYGLGDAMREDTNNLQKLDDMVTIAKKALKRIVSLTASKEIELIATTALLKIERIRNRK